MKINHKASPKKEDANISQENIPTLPQRLCKCGCGTLFPPKRIDHVYATKKHGNFGYNHGPRKQRQIEGSKVEKQLRLNDRILAKYFKAGNGIFATCLSLNLKADGFDSSSFTGIVGKPEERYFLVYNYMFHMYTKDRYPLVKIMKK